MKGPIRVGGQAVHGDRLQRFGVIGPMDHAARNALVEGSLGGVPDPRSAAEEIRAQGDQGSEGSSTYAARRSSWWISATS